MTSSVAASPASSNTLSAGLRNAAKSSILLDHPEYSLDVVIPDASAAKDSSLIQAIVRLANTVFQEAEAGLWNEGAFLRTTPDVVAQMLLSRQLALGYLSAGGGTAPLAPSADEYHYTDPEGQQLVGCICVKQQSPTAGYVGMLALDKRYQGLGLARHLMAFAEKRLVELGCSTVELDLLYPTAFVHPLKARMNAWYLRMGYELVRVSRFGDIYPDFAPLLASPVESRIFEKRLC